jgi:hypothetical protein
LFGIGFERIVFPLQKKLLFFDLSQVFTDLTGQLQSTPQSAEDPLFTDFQSNQSWVLSALDFVLLCHP